jgi:hypothetical protein
MEEKKKLEEEKVEKRNNKQKLSYEDLETVAKQFAAQLEAASVENQQLKLKVQQLQLGNMYTELEFRFKVLQNAEMFSPDFVEMCVKSIEDTMTPVEESLPEENDGEEEG